MGICKICGKEGLPDRGYCQEHYLKYNRQKSKQYSDTHKSKCPLCGASIYTNKRRNNQVCADCYSHINKTSYTVNHYVYVGLGPKKTHLYFHTELAKACLNRELLSTEVVHHLDLDSKNNHSSNLVVLDRKVHNKLHSALREYKVILHVIGIFEEELWVEKLLEFTNNWFTEMDETCIYLKDSEDYNYNTLVTQVKSLVHRKTPSMRIKEEQEKQLKKTYKELEKQKQIEERKNILDNIDTLKFGWVAEASRRLGVSHTQVRKFVEKYYPELERYKRHLSNENT